MVSVVFTVVITVDSNNSCVSWLGRELMCLIQEHPAPVRCKLRMKVFPGILDYFEKESNLSAIWNGFIYIDFCGNLGAAQMCAVCMCPLCGNVCCVYICTYKSMYVYVTVYSLCMCM